MSELWYPLAKRVDGPWWKNRGSTNGNEGAIFHSAVGYKGGLTYEMFRTDRGAAWHFDIYQNGQIVQYYPINAVLWHAGDWGTDDDGADGNGETIGIEFEGGLNPHNEPLTQHQIRAAQGLARWLGEQGGWTPSRRHPHRTLWEHNELSDNGTTCPNDRINWADFEMRIPLVAELKEGDGAQLWMAWYDQEQGSDISQARIRQVARDGNRRVIIMDVPESY